MSIKERVLDAMIRYEQSKPRNAQLTLGPSELGACREYIRNVMIGAPRQSSDMWPTAAVVGTLVGEYMERVMEGEGALTEVPVTTVLPSGLKVSGHADIVMVDDNLVIDCKTKDQLAGVETDGPSLENMIQVSVYTVGLVQAGVLKQGAKAYLLYVDRSGNQQYLHEVELDWDAIMRFIALCEERLRDVVEAQEHIDRGEVEYARDLRDKTPSWCYSEKVLCPFRDACWKGSEWNPHEVIEDAETVENVQRFVRARDDERAAIARKRELREALRGVSGVTPDGYSVVWSGSEKSPALYVTRVGK